MAGQGAFPGTGGLRWAGVPDLCEHTNGWEAMQVDLVHVTIHWAHECDMRTIAPNLQQLCAQQCHCTAVDAGPFSHLFMSTM
jgi:hypothetical protein